MNPLFVITAIRAAARVGRTAADAFEQYTQERPTLFPDVEILDQGPTLYIREVADQYPEFAVLLASDEELSKLWVDGAATAVPGAEDAVLAVARRFVTRRAGKEAHLGALAQDEIAGGMMVGQWAKGKGPVRPWARIVVALTDVALEYVGSHPQVLGVGGNGEKLIGAITTAISERIPDGEDRDALGAKDRFAERLAAIVLHSGLKTMSEKPELVFGEAHLQELLKHTLPPVIDALPSTSVTEQVEWRRLVDSLLGPAISGALESIAAAPTAFFGRKFAAEEAAGVMVTGLLKAAAEVDIKTRFTKEGLLALFQAATAVAAENPELILGELLDADLGDPAFRDRADTVALEVFKSVAEALKDRQPPYGDDLGTAVAVAAINGLKAGGPALFGNRNPWHRVVATLTAQTLDGFAEALGDRATLLSGTAFSKDRLVDLARVFIRQVAETPHLVAGGNDEMRRVVAAVAGAMVRDEHLLLTSEDWIRIARVTAEEAASNPGRLFGVAEASLQGTLATDIVGRLLTAAQADLTRDDREVGPLMTGAILRECIIITIRGIAGNVQQAFEHRTAFETLANRLNDAAARRGLSMGGKEWLRIFRVLLPGVVSTGAVPELDDAKITALLAG